MNNEPERITKASAEEITSIADIVTKEITQDITEE